MSVILRVGAVKPTGGQESHYGSGDEASSSYADSGDVWDIPLPEHTYQRPLPPTSTHAHNNMGYFGLPYQDHNYGMLPPPSPPRPVSPRPQSPLQVNGVVQMEEEVKTTPLVSVVEEVVEDSVTRCICGYLHDDGYMICCDKCSVWQHIDCMGVDRNNIPDSYYCEMCQPRALDAAKAKSLQKRKREELAARNVLSDSSATDTDPEEAANALASMGKKLPGGKKKGLKQKRNSKMKDKPPLKLKLGKALSEKKTKKAGKKEKENIKSAKSKKMFKSGSQKIKMGKMKNRPLLTLEQLSADPWNSNLSPWVDSYENAHENQYSTAVRELACTSHLMNQSVDISSIMPDQLLGQLTCVADVKKNRKGLRAAQEIPAGQAIIEYKGRVILRHDYDQEHSFVNSFKKLQPFVLFYSNLDVDLCIDARMFGNDARFIRRSCTPNSEVQHIFSQGKIYFVIVSKKDISSGSEITIPFDYNYQDCSYCVECACLKNNCVVSRFWKKMKMSQKSSKKDFPVKRKRQSSGGDKVSLKDGSNSSSAQGSPFKSCASPVKSSPMTPPALVTSPPRLSSPVKLSNVSTLLAASALLDGQPELASSLKLDLDVPESLQQAPPPPAPPPPPPKSATSSRRGSRLSEDSVKEEKPAVHGKEKQSKTKEAKTKEKESKDHHYHHTEVKKERRPSSRRQSQDDSEDVIEHKPSLAPPGNESEDSNTATESRKKMTREERKLDAIMKAFEKMEKREERRKEAMQHGHGSRKPSGDSKKEEHDGVSSCGSVSHSRSVSQDGLADEGENIKVEPVSDDQQETKVDVKPPSENSCGESPSSGSANIVKAGTSTSSTGASQFFLASSSSSSISSTIFPVKEESPQKPTRKSGKRKRRRSRVQSTTALSDAASVSTDEGNSNSSFPPAPLSTPATPAPTPVTTPMPPSETEGAVFKYIKTKKHLFDEWSNKQEDENKQDEEMFVQCLPNPHVNTMDHLQRRNSHSSGCNSRGPESNAGSAKKRWLRQAMHEVPAPAAYNHSLSVSTDSGGGSPVHGDASPNPGSGMASPGAGSSIDFVTPLKKRRLMRESLSSETNGTMASPSAGVLAENFTANSVSINHKANGVKQLLPPHRHSTDDRLLLHKSSQQNGFREATAQNSSRKVATAAVSPSISIHSRLNGACVHPENSGKDLHDLAPDARDVESLPVSVSLTSVNGLSESVPVSSMPFIQPTVTKVPVKFRGIFERMEVDSSGGEMFKEKEIRPIASSSRVEENGFCSLKPPPGPSWRSRATCKYQDETGLESCASTSSSTLVVVNSSSVYSSVNSLMDEGSEAGCVTAKTIMDEDSPATVCVDLNAHEMEPSSLSDSNAVVNLSDTFFSHSLRASSSSRSLDPPSDCQVNSSEDVVESLPLLPHVHHNSADICDNVCTDSGSAHRGVVGQRDREDERQVSGSDEEEDHGVVDSSQHVNRTDRNSEEIATVFEDQGRHALADTDFPQAHVPARDADTECSSSSGQLSQCRTSDSHVDHSVVCDSVEEDMETLAESESEGASRQCDSGSVDVETSRSQEDNDSSLDGDQVRPCDSVAGNLTRAEPSTSGAVETTEDEDEMGDGAVSESHCSDSPAVFVHAIDSNVDSTSNETSRGLLEQPAADSCMSSVRPRINSAVDNCCDSNSDRQANVGGVNNNPILTDESSLEGLGVSSSDNRECQASHSSSNSIDRLSVNAASESLPDDAVSTQENLETSQSLPATQAFPNDEDLGSSDAQPSVAVTQSSTTQPSINFSLTINSSTTPHTNNSVGSTVTVNENSAPSAATTACIPTDVDALSPHKQTLHPAPSTSSSSSSSSSPTAPLSVSVVEGTPSSSSSGMAVSPSRTPGAASCSSAVPVTTSPISSTAEAAPTKKKVSLLEYRKRLKQKPASSSSELKSSTTSLSSTASSSSSTIHHKLSSTLSLYLASSSPTSSASPSKSPSNHDGHKKSRMPTLATLPLFKSAEPKKEEKKKAKPKPKPEKPLSLTERLRLEFGLEDCQDDKKHKGEDSEVASSNGSVDDSVPPPPPPTTVAGFPAVAAAGFGVSSTQPRPGVHASPAQLSNGGSGSSFGYQQQANISSTSLPTPPPSLLSPHLSASRERLIPPVAGPMASPPLVPPPYQQLQQQQPSSSLLPAAPLLTAHPHHAWVNTQTPPPPLPQPSTNQHPSQQASTNHPHPSSLQYDFVARQATQTCISGSGGATDDHPPPPPPPPPRLYHRPSSTSSSSSSSSSFRHHNHSSSGKSNSSKAAASSSTSSSSSSASSRYTDNRNRY